MNWFFVLIGILLLVYIIRAVIKKRFDLYESIFWIFASVVIILLSAFPKSLDSIAIKFGVSYSPSLVFLIGIIFLLFINFRQTRMINDNKQKINDISQELSILKEKVKEIENR